MMIINITMGAFHSPKNSGNSGFGSDWNRHFPEFHSQILGIPREVGLKFRKIGITGEFRSIRPFLLAPSFSEPGNRTQHGFQFFCSISVFRLLICDRWLECSFAPEPRQTFVSSAKMYISFAQCLKLMW